MDPKKGATMKVRSSLDQQRLDADVLRNAEEFASLEEEWEQLYENCPSATPFQSWAWLYSWWESYSEGYELRLVTVRDRDGLLVGVLPLMLKRRWGFGQLLFVGSGATDYLDMLAREGREEEVARAATIVLRAMGGWRVVDLQELRPEASAWALHRTWLGRKNCIWQSNCPLLDVKPWDDQLMLLKQKLRSSVRQALRRAKEDGLCTQLVGTEDAVEAAKRLVALHRNSWQARGIGLGHMNREFEALLEVATHRMIACGLGAISEFRLGGEVVVSHFVVIGRDFVGGYIFGANKAALKRYQVSSLCIVDDLSIARTKGLPYMSHLRGEEPYKLRWSSRVVPNYRSILYRDGSVLLAYTGYQLLRSKVEAYVSSENAPPWVVKTVIRYRDVRTRVSRYRKRILKWLPRTPTS
jgi:CelD/BcsL family acetyltransferase involved in cellulose biosynthesis